MEPKNFLLDAEAAQSGLSGPSFSLRNRVERSIFQLVWSLVAAWTPPPMHKWRCFLLRRFGAKIGQGVRIYGSTIVWHPANLFVGDYATIGPRVRLYNQGAISVGSNVVISQGAHICASTHRINDPFFQLVLKPVVINARAWIAADAFVGPGVRVGEGAVLGARAAAFSDLDPWTIYRGNPAAPIKMRSFAKERLPTSSI